MLLLHHLLASIDTNVLRLFCTRPACYEYYYVHDEYYLVPTLVSNLSLEINGLEDDLSDKECPLFESLLTITAHIYYRTI